VKIVEAGRFLLPHGARASRRFAERNLLSIHGRAARLRAIVRGARLHATERKEAEADEALHAALQLPAARDADWLMVRDYSGTGRGRSVLFFFADDSDVPRTVVKVRRHDAGGRSLAHESSVLNTIRRLLPETLRATLPEVREFGVTAHHELLVLGGLPGQPLWLSMQRSLRPHAAHARHLIEAGRWLGEVRAAAPVVHGDFWPRNVLFRGTTLTGVVDWEHGAASGEPWDDLFTLPFLFATGAPAWGRIDKLRAFRRAFLEENRAMRAYFEATGFTDLHDRFDDYLGRKEEQACRELLRNASRSVFSG
jgi:hypothetical protein